MKWWGIGGVAAFVLGFLALALWPTGTAPSPTQPELVRSERLELETISPVTSSLYPQLAWMVPPHQPGWGELEPPATPELAALKDTGAELYAARCASCHGPDGLGDGVFASELPRRPRDLHGPLRTRSASGGVEPGELYRTLTVGAARYGMPSFAHLPSEDRWALVAHLLTWREAEETTPVDLAAAPESPDLHLGQDLYRQACAECHGRDGEGTAAGAVLLGSDGAPAPATDLAFGPEAFRAGARPIDIARTLQTGRLGTSMVPFTDYSNDELWALASYVSALSEVGYARRSQSWNTFFEQQAAAVVHSGTVEVFLERWDPEHSKNFDTADEAGCLACHEGIEEIAEGSMQASIDAFAGGDPARGCTVCHQGDPLASDKKNAHQGLLSNPGNLWVTSLGLGCGRCHSDLGALTSLKGEPFPEPRGGDLMAVVSRVSDPTGASGSNHAYRMQRALMAQESGKVTLFAASVGLSPADKPLYTDFSLDDPDGQVPCSGSPAYKELMARAVETGYVTPLAKTQGLPTYDEALELGLTEAGAAYVDYFRKDCVRCHLWGEGKPSNGEFRPSGCSACHVLSSMKAYSGSDDRTIPALKSGHIFKHKLVTAIPESQCNHCHTRGLLTEHSEAHQVAGIGCADCHTSIDVHGDGNIYPSIEHQLEVRCEDCHGKAGVAPWDLPLSVGTPAAGKAPRGVHAQDDREYMLTNRGNPRTNLRRERGRVVLESRYTGKKHVAPLLGAGSHGGGGEGEPDVHAQVGHEDLSCALCHSRQAEMCAPCHIRYYRDSKAQDWLLSALDHTPDGRSQKVVTAGEPVAGSMGMGMGGGGMSWVTPETRKDRAGRLIPQVPGCNVELTFIPKDGERSGFSPKMNYGFSDYPPPIAPTVVHEFALPPRTCADCHFEMRDKDK